MQFSKPYLLYLTIHLYWLKYIGLNWIGLKIYSWRISRYVNVSCVYGSIAAIFGYFFWLAIWKKMNNSEYQSFSKLRTNPCHLSTFIWSIRPRLNLRRRLKKTMNYWILSFVMHIEAWYKKYVRLKLNFEKVIWMINKMI